jgi:hypothetical protein
MSTVLFTPIILSIALLCALPSLAGAANPTLVPPENANLGLTPHENLADAAEQVLKAVRETHYQHRTHVDTAAGAYDVDCSGFVDYLLKRVAPAQFAQLPIEAGHSRPRAQVYYAFLHDLRRAPSPLPGWESVGRLIDARRGDLLAWKRMASIQREGDTGHVVIVAGPPTTQSDGTFKVEVYDSSGIHHDFDSRTEGTSGVGKGVITFRVDSQGEPIAVRFNSGANFHEEPIAIGRLAD